MNRPLPGEKAQKIFLIVSVVLNLTLLGFFKYFDFFRGSCATHGRFGRRPAHAHAPHPSAWHFLLHLPVHELHHRRVPRHLKASANLGRVAVFVAFFPQLVAGPSPGHGTASAGPESPYVTIGTRSWTVRTGYSGAFKRFFLYRR